MGAISVEDVQAWERGKKTKKLLKALAVDDDRVCAEAAKALARIGAPKAVEPMIARLDQGLMWAYEDAVLLALGEFRDARAIPTLIEHLTSTHSNVDRAAATALDKIGPAIVGPLIETLGSPYAAARRWAAQLLGYRHDASAVDALCERLTDDDNNVRLVSAEALAAIGDPRAIEPLSKALGKNDTTFAGRAIKEALETLRAGGTGPDEGRGAMVSVTIKIGGPMHGSTEHVGDYNATLPLDGGGGELLNTIAGKIVRPNGPVRYYNGYQLVCPKGTMTCNDVPPTTVRDFGVNEGDTLELVDWGGSFV